MQQWDRQKTSLEPRFQSSVMEVSIEDIVDAPNERTHDIFSFIGAEPDDVNDAAAVFSAQSAHIGRWRTEMSNDVLLAANPF